MRVRQIVTNLVANAVKFTERGHVLVSVREETRNDGCTMLHFAVNDTGIGIPPEKQRTIFEAFSQADGSTTRRFGGTGLGLAISSTLVQMMGGRIWVESESGTGSTFHFTAAFDLAADTTPALEHSRLEQLRVLIIDDNAVNRRILEASTRTPSSCARSNAGTPRPSSATRPAGRSLRRPHASGDRSAWCCSTRTCRVSTDSRSPHRSSCDRTSPARRS